MKYKFTLPDDINYDQLGPAFNWKRMDEGPKVNCLGQLCILLYRLGLQSPREVLEGKTPKPKYNRYYRNRAPNVAHNYPAYVFRMTSLLEKLGIQHARYVHAEDVRRFCYQLRVWI